MLNHKVEIYVPRNTAKQEGVMADTFYRFCKVFGGATVGQFLTGYIDNDQIKTSKIGIISSYTPEITDKTRKLLKKIAVEVRQTLNEDTIKVVFDGSIEFY